MTLPPRIRKEAKRDGRWRSPAHCNFVRSHACCACGSTFAIEVAHVRSGSDAGMGRKPSDYFTVSLCQSCHNLQHRQGERTFWQGKEVAVLVKAFCDASPKRREIEAHKREAGL